MSCPFPDISFRLALGERPATPQLGTWADEEAEDGARIAGIFDRFAAASPDPRGELES